MHIYIHACIHILYIYTYIQGCREDHLSTYASIYIYTHTYMYAYIHTGEDHLSMYICTYMYIYTHIHTWFQGGSLVHVTNENKHDYVRLASMRRLVTGIQPQVNQHIADHALYVCIIRLSLI
jgi:hypothetical protein